MVPPWIDGLRAVMQLAAGAVPALLVVAIAGVLALLALACGPGRRDYALAYTDRCIALAAVLIGAPRPRPER